MCPCKIALLVGVAVFLIVVLGTLWKKRQEIEERIENKLFDWEVELGKAAPNWKKMQELASSWNTCAVGTYYTGKCVENGNKKGMPYNSQVENLGYDFHWAVCDEDVDAALSIIQQIKELEERRKKDEST